VGVLLPIHIVAGGMAIILGAMAPLASKGATLHRRSGLLFVYAMLTMGMSIVLVFVAMFYWLWRVRGRRTLALAR